MACKQPRQRRGGPALPDAAVEHAGKVVELDDCRYEPPPRPAPASTDRPVLHRDGTISWAGRTVDVHREGLPVMDIIELPAGHLGETGRFLLTASSEVRRPTREQILVAVTLAEQLTEPQNGPPQTDTSNTQTRPPPSVTG